MSELNNPLLVGPLDVPASAPRYKLWFDGSASEGGNGRLACGYLIEEPDGTRHPTAFAPGAGTNNEAEYTACLHGLRHLGALIKAPQAHVTVIGDSMLVIHQVFGTWRIKAPNLRPFHAEVRSVIARFNVRGVAVIGQWVPRQQNTEADALCAQAMTLAEYAG